jgi:hypothetical protein
VHWTVDEQSKRYREIGGPRMSYGVEARVGRYRLLRNIPPSLSTPPKLWYSPTFSISKHPSESTVDWSGFLESCTSDLSSRCAEDNLCPCAVLAVLLAKVQTPSEVCLTLRLAVPPQPPHSSCSGVLACRKRPHSESERRWTPDQLPKVD